MSNVEVIESWFCLACKTEYDSAARAVACCGDLAVKGASRPFICECGRQYNNYDDAEKCCSVEWRKWMAEVWRLVAGNYAQKKALQKCGEDYSRDCFNRGYSPEETLKMLAA
jgi:hypothetical protein